MKKRVIITGSNGQLGQCLQTLKAGHQELEFYFLDKSMCDVTSRTSVKKAFQEIKPHYLVNAAAFTAVDDAENNPDDAFSVNAYALRNIVFEMGNAKCIHISTDYVYHHKVDLPISEKDKTFPKGVYAKSKLLGEQILISSGVDAMIIRTSWLYSEFGKNFLKTMVRLSDVRKSISVVNDQIGSPTYGMDLAMAIQKIIVDDSRGLIIGSQWKDIYNFSNRGEVSWYDFAKEIFAILNSNVELISIPSVLYPTSAVRPAWSVLDTEKIEKAFGIEIIDWKVSLRKCIANLIN